MRSDKHSGSASGKSISRLQKILVPLILTLIFLIMAATVRLYRIAEKSISLSFAGDDISVEFGGEYPSMDYVADSEGVVTPASKLLDAGSVGEHTMKYKVTKPVLGGILAPEKVFTLKYEVTDSTPPVALWNGDGAVVKTGSKFYINDVISYGDNADPEPSVTYESNVNTAVPGSYPVHVSVTDASGNVTNWNTTVEVADEQPSSMDSTERTKFSDFVSAYKGDGRSFGIDVSDWQDDIDFEAVKKAGCSFVIIRIGWSEKGKVNADKFFDQNLERARAAGLKVGVYLYSYDSTKEDVKKSAQYITKKLGRSGLELPVVFDWEDFGKFQEYKMSFKDLNDLYDTFAKELSKGGYDCMLYGSKNYLEKVWDKTDKRPVWLAHYTDKTDYEGPYRIWQASCSGSISGIDGAVDMDIMYED